MKSKPTLQSIILQLQQFWASQGCLIWQPYHTEVGAGTMNPATYLRVLGPEDWWVAYVEPSIRPADSRYGENPNRWGHYYQFQVILKPDPGDPQERYLQSLVALGIDPLEHDIRFVEDNWEQPALGAWGLGWEVWLDGQEITQFTYFQQAGGKTLDPPAVEITYGLERILLVLQSVESFVELDFNEKVTYGEVLLEAEREHSRYIFEVADVERLQQMFEEFEAEANSCLANGLIFPAHDYVLKCSHTFNLLDGRGAIGVTERAAIFGRMRDLARKVTDGYLALREEAGFPWVGRWSQEAVPPLPVDAGQAPVKAADFILELGTEELPVGDLTQALEQLRRDAPSFLEELSLDHEGVEVHGTPRRIVLIVRGLHPTQQDELLLEKGPPFDRAYDEKGNPTKAAEGFARGKGIAVADLEQEEIDGGVYVIARVERKGQPAAQILRENLPELIASLRFDKSMRWNQSGVAFSRPIRWILALHGEQVISFSFAGVNSGRSTRTLRFDDPPVREIRDLDDYLHQLRQAGIILDEEARRERIAEMIQALAAEVGGSLPEDELLLEEVTNLVEKPHALLGQFDPAFLELPRAVLISVMKKHQRYFPLEKAGELLPYFITVRNGGDANPELVLAGNEQVLRARFADARYFVERDLKKPLKDYLPDLASLTFESSLGSMLDKTQRIASLTEEIIPRLGLGSEEAEAARQAASLCKADLVTRMVIEMTSLQGEVGRVYALRSGEPEAVAEAIREHYQPRYAGDALPGTMPGIAVGLSDRFDTLAGLFAAGHQPSGARDPFALRRTAIGLLQILIGRGISLELDALLSLAGENLPLAFETEHLEACQSFIRSRLQAILLADGFGHDVIEAVLEEQSNNPTYAAEAVRALQVASEGPGWDALLQAYARCARITRGESTAYSIDPGQLVEPAEQELHAALLSSIASKPEPGSVGDFLRILLSIVPAINRFFDEVLVMVDDAGLRDNRLALLQKITGLADGVCDLSQMEGF